MTDPNGRRRLGRYATGAAALCLAAGLTCVGVGLIPTASNAEPPGTAGIRAPAATATAPTTAHAGSTPSPGPTSVPSTPPPPASMPRSVPVHLRIPAIGVDTGLMQLGLNKDGTLQVPPYDKTSPPGWYRGSPTPGQIGPSVILGHVDTYKAGPTVFYRLAQLKPGDHIFVRRQDGTTAEFTTDKVENVPKAHFPQLEVYGNTPDAELRLITCGGDWNPTLHHYTDNTVVFAHLIPTGGR